MTLDVYGELKKASETGDGPVDAIFKCIKKLYPHEVKLQLYQVHYVTEVTDASKNRKDQSNFSADDGSGNTWKVGTDTYRQAVQAMTPGQGVKKFSNFRKVTSTK